MSDYEHVILWPSVDWNPERGSVGYLDDLEHLRVVRIHNGGRVLVASVRCDSPSGETFPHVCESRTYPHACEVVIPRRWNEPDLYRELFRRADGHTGRWTEGEAA